MALTITNTNTLTLLNILNRNLAAQATTLTQLATGKRINSAKDDPAGLVAFSSLNTELTAVRAALTNNQRTDAMLTVMDSAMGEISTLLGDIEQLVLAATGDADLTAGEIAVRQAQIDDALSAIDRIVQSTTFNGKKLLDGTLAIRTEGAFGNPFINDLRVFSRSQSSADTVLTVELVAPAQAASAVLAEAGVRTHTAEPTELAITGSLGTAVITLASGTSQVDVVGAINQVTAQTGVVATANPNNIEIHSTGYGADAFVSVEVLSGGKITHSNGQGGGQGNTADDIQNVSRQYGADAVVTINGQSAGVDGLDVYYSANGLSLVLTMSADFGTGNTPGTTSTSFTVLAAGGATFQLGTTVSTRQTIGVDSLATYFLGGGDGTLHLSALRSGQTAALDNDPTAALTAVREAIAEVSGIRSRISGFQRFQVGSAIRTLQAAEVGLTDAISAIMDTDFAAATAKLNREQILIEAGISLLGIANQQAEQILSLLYDRA